MKYSAELKKINYLKICIVLFSFLYFSSGISRSPLFFYDEARNSGCAREMAEKNDLVVPTFNYELRSDKPPLHYYFMILSYKIFGVSEFSSRIFSAFFGALTLLLIFSFVDKYIGQKVALWTVLILLASLNFSLEFHLAVPDPYFIFFVTAANLTFFDYYQTRKKIILMLMYLCAGLAILVKGPVAAVLFAVTWISFLFFRKDLNWKTIKQYKFFSGILIMAIIILPWFIKVGLATDWLWQKEFFLKQNMERFTSAMEGHGGFWGLTIIYVFFAFLPFSLFLIQSFIEIFRIWKSNDLLLFSLIVSVAFIFFFTVSATKLPNYPMPCYPFIAIIIAYYLTHARVKYINQLIIAYLIVCLILLFTVRYLLKVIDEVHLFNYLIWFFLIIVIGAVITVYIRIRKRNIDLMFISLSGTWIIASLVIFLWIIPSISQQDPVRMALQVIDKSKPFAYYGRCNSSFPFYLKKPIIKLSTINEVSQYLKRYPDGYLISAAEFQKELSILPLKEILIKKDLFEPPVTVVYRSDN